MSFHEFDPYNELLVCAKNIQELARAHNKHSEIIEQILDQNRRLNELLKVTRLEMHRLHTELELLKRSD